MERSKDYWLELLKLTDEQGKIRAPRNKDIKEYLAKCLNLSRPTIKSLLATWEEKGRICLTKEGFLQKAVGLQIIPAKEELRRTVLLVDWENLFQNLYPAWKQELTPKSVSQGFLNLIKQISREVGEVVSVFVFGPPHLMDYLWAKAFREQKFFPIICYQMPDKKGVERDTVDETLTDLGEKLINSMKLSHLCVASGDKDFVPLYLDAIAKGLKTVTIAASETSLSLAPELIEVSDKIIIFPPIEKKRD